MSSSIEQQLKKNNLILIHVLDTLYEEVETHMIHKKERQVIVCGRFRPSDVAVKLQKKMKRRVEILEIEDLTSDHVGGGGEAQEYEQPYEPPHEYSPQPDHIMTTPLLC